MDYTKHYNTLCKRGQVRLLEGYSEIHHIIPRCLGGTDHNTNLTRLTPEEHYIAHQLLVQMHPGNRKLIYSAQMMTVDRYAGGPRSQNKLYGWLKRQLKDARKDRPAFLKGKKGWFNNGTEEKFCTIGEEPKGYVRKRLPGRTYDTPRKLAKTLGFIKYLGKTCPENHNGLRYVSTGNCVECLTI